MKKEFQLNLQKENKRNCFFIRFGFWPEDFEKIDDEIVQRLTNEELTWLSDHITFIESLKN